MVYARIVSLHPLYLFWTYLNANCYAQSIICLNMENITTHALDHCPLVRPSNHCHFVEKIVPGASPRNVTAVALDSRSIEVSWVPPPLETHNGLITNYIIKYWKVKDRKYDGHVVDTIAPVDVTFVENDVPISKSVQDEDFLKVKDISVDASLRSYVVKNLEEWTSYKITVSAATKIGAGPPSANLTIRTDESGMLAVPTFIFPFPMYYLFNERSHSCLEL